MSEPETRAESLPMLRGERVWLRAAEKADFVSDAPAVSDAETGHLLGLKMPVSAEGGEQFAKHKIFAQGQSV
jgi:hypothetical protein